MKSLLYSCLLAAAISLSSCSTEPEPINFGKDQCEHCRMTIVDNKFGAELITSKGKIYKYDAVECMVNFLHEGKVKKEDVSGYYAVNTARPANLINAETSVYLFSQNFPSPMGEYLSAYGSREEADEFLKKYEGTLMNWNEIVNKLESK